MEMVLYQLHMVPRQRGGNTLYSQTGNMTQGKKQSGPKEDCPTYTPAMLLQLLQRIRDRLFEPLVP